MPETLIIIETRFADGIAGVSLLPNAEPDIVWKKMAAPDMYVHSYSLSHAMEMHPTRAQSLGVSKGYNLVPQDHRSPYNAFEGFRTMLRTKWLGLSADSIDQQIVQLEEILQELRRESINRRLPPPLPGQS